MTMMAMMSSAPVPMPIGASKRCVRPRGARRLATTAAAAGAAGAGGVGLTSAAPPQGILFDCDGVISETEKDGHRVSFNDAFGQLSIEATWDVELYGELLRIGGGKERMTHYFSQRGWPTAEADFGGPQGLVQELHRRKTATFMDMVRSGALPLRPRVDTLMRQALDAGIRVAVCSTSNEKAVEAIVTTLLPDVADRIRIFAGDVVPKKKPDPAIYLLAAQELGLDPARCVVIEDSQIGLQAATGAGMRCIVTMSAYTKDEAFEEADIVLPEINFDLADISLENKELLDRA